MLCPIGEEVTISQTVDWVDVATLSDEGRATCHKLGESRRILASDGTAYPSECREWVAGARYGDEGDMTVVAGDHDLTHAFDIY